MKTCWAACVWKVQCHAVKIVFKVFFQTEVFSVRHFHVWIPKKFTKNNRKPNLFRTEVYCICICVLLMFWHMSIFDWHSHTRIYYQHQWMFKQITNEQTHERSFTPIVCVNCKFYTGVLIYKLLVIGIAF